MTRDASSEETMAVSRNVKGIPSPRATCNTVHSCRDTEAQSCRLIRNIVCDTSKNMMNLKMKMRGLY